MRAWEVPTLQGTEFTAPADPHKSRSDVGLPSCDRDGVSSGVGGRTRKSAGGVDRPHSSTTHPMTRAPRFGHTPNARKPAANACAMNHEGAGPSGDAERRDIVTAPEPLLRLAAGAGADRVHPAKFQSLLRREKVAARVRERARNVLRPYSSPAPACGRCCAHGRDHGRQRVRAAGEPRIVGSRRNWCRSPVARASLAARGSTSVHSQPRFLALAPRGAPAGAWRSPSLT